MVSEKQIKELPLNGRSFDNLITLNPGAVSFSAMKSPNTTTSDGNTFSVEGRRSYENLFLVNGIELTGSSQLGISPGGVSGDLLGVDAIREFNLLTDTYGAEYGKRAGGQVMAVTQSGTNTLHGSLYEFLRNSDLDARNFFDQGSVPPFRRNQFGGSLGGPLKKDKWFLFGNYEGFRQSLAVSNVSVVPDAQARLGLLPNAAGVYTPVANLNPAMLQYMQLWPVANGPELTVGGLPAARRSPSTIPSRPFVKISAPCDPTTYSASATPSRPLTPSTMATASSRKPTRCSRPLKSCAARLPAWKKRMSSRPRS